MTIEIKLCRIATITQENITQKFWEGVIRMLLILALIGVVLDVPHEVVGGLLALFLIKETA